MSAPVITFLSDYGLEDEFVGVCHGVIATVCPQARVIDLAHGVRRHDVRQGAIMLAQALRYVPGGVHLAVVDPGVGGERRAVAIALADGQVLVGPDNGLLSLAFGSGGGVADGVDIGRSRFALEPVSATFHGRDIFAPVAAALAGGEPLRAVGEPIEAAGLVRLELPQPRHEDGGLIVHVRQIDRFGNMQLNAGPEALAGSGLELGRLAELQPGHEPPHHIRYLRTFADAEPGELLLYSDAQQLLTVAVNRGSAAHRLGLAVDDELRIRA